MKWQHHDNDRDVIKTQDTSSIVGQRPDFEANLEQRTEELLNHLEEHIRKSLKDLEDNELKASYDFATWLQNIKKENSTLESELARKQSYEAKLKEDLVDAEKYEAQTHSEYDNALAAYNAKKAECDHKEEYYKRETARRNDENVDIDECIKIMEEVIPDLEDYTRKRADNLNSASVPDKRTDDYSLDRSKYEAAGGYTA